VNGSELLPLLRAGVRFVDGVYWPRILPSSSAVGAGTTRGGQQHILIRPASKRLINSSTPRLRSTRSSSLLFCRATPSLHDDSHGAVHNDRACERQAAPQEQG
jgi:hypothetical protein